MAPDREGIARALMLETAVRDKVHWVAETIPAFNRLLITASAAEWDSGALAAAVQPLAEAAVRDPVAWPDERTVELPACYDPEVAPDLQDLASRTGLTPAEIVAVHSGRDYTVLATGFAPGFAYLGDVDPSIAAPRHTAPRRRVEAGSVGIADRRTGVYPSDSPGGWRLIGRVPAALFADPRERAERFRPGQTVRFRPIPLAEFEAAG